MITLGVSFRSMPGSPKVDASVDVGPLGDEQNLFDRLSRFAEADVGSAGVAEKRLVYQKRTSDGSRRMTQPVTVDEIHKAEL